eukprot:scaffold201_cov405-Prasinococcus_capsulatus_cf.AAC.61
MTAQYLFEIPYAVASLVPVGILPIGRGLYNDAVPPISFGAGVAQGGNKNESGIGSHLCGERIIVHGWLSWSPVGWAYFAMLVCVLESGQ